MSFSIHSLYEIIFKVWRRKRYFLFLREIQPQSNETMRDVGGYPKNWTSFPQAAGEIHCLNMHKVEWQEEQYPSHNISTLCGDGCAMEFPNNTYDIVFSNSVIEHVGNMDRIEAFASEVRRVGKRLWLQTPAYDCPIEPHFLAPCVHWFPESIRRRIVRWATPWGWIERPSKDRVVHVIDTTRLLTKSEMKRLFPDCRIITERFLAIIPKSHIAIRTYKHE